MIGQIHKTGDYQTEFYTVGQGGVKRIERFTINGLHAEYPRLRVHRENGGTIEMDEAGMTIYETPTEGPER